LALCEEVEQAREAGIMGQDEIDAVIRRYEEKYSLSTQDFLRLRQEQRVPDYIDEVEMIDWANFVNYRE